MILNKEFIFIFKIECKKKKKVGIASVWFEGNPCNMHLLQLSEQVKKATQEAGLVAFRFNTGYSFISILDQVFL